HPRRARAEHHHIIASHAGALAHIPRRSAYNPPAGGGAKSAARRAGPAFIDSCPIRRKSRSSLEGLAMRDDLMDIEIRDLDSFAPGRIFVPFSLKAKTAKTTR